MRKLTPKPSNKLQSLNQSQREKVRDAYHDPVKFVYTFFKDFKGKPFKLDWYQAEVIRCEARWIVVNAGRQTGKSETLCNLAIYEAFTKPNQMILIISRSQRQAGHMLHKVRSHIEDSEVLARSITQASRSEVTLDNGSKIISLPPSAPTIRGYSATLVLLDEAAWFKKGADEVYYEAIKPMVIRTGGRVILASTPAGKQGFFWEMYNEWKKLDNGAVFDFPAIYEGKVLCPAMEMQDLMDEKRILGDLSFRQEYMAEFIDEGILYFANKLVNNSINHELELKSFGEPDGIYYMGIDWGKASSSTIITIIEENKLGKHKVVHLKEFKKTPYDEVIGYVSYLAENFRIKKCLADTGAGQAQIDTLKSMGLRIEGYNFSVQSKIDLFSFMRQLMEHGRVELPPNEEMRRQFISFTQEISKSGKILLHAPEGEHDDYVDSISLAFYNLHKPRSKLFVSGVKKVSPRFVR